MNIPAHSKYGEFKGQRIFAWRPDPDSPFPLIFNVGKEWDNLEIDPDTPTSVLLKTILEKTQDKSGLVNVEATTFAMRQALGIDDSVDLRKFVMSLLRIAEICGLLPEADITVFHIIID